MADNPFLAMVAETNAANSSYGGNNDHNHHIENLIETQISDDFLYTTQQMENPLMMDLYLTTIHPNLWSLSHESLTMEKDGTCT